MNHLKSLSLALLLCLLLAGCDQSKRAWQLDIYNSTSNQKSSIDETDITNKLLVINYWAEWCKPCIEEMPELNRLAQAQQDRALVLGVNFDGQQGAELQAAMLKVGMTFPAITTNIAAVFVLPDISGLPTTLILDEHGVLKEQLLGPQTHSSLEAALLRNRENK